MESKRNKKTIHGLPRLQEEPLDDHHQRENELTRRYWSTSLTRRARARRSVKEMKNKEKQASGYIELKPTMIARILLYPMSAFVIFVVSNYVIDVGFDFSVYANASIVVLFYLLSFLPLCVFRKRMLRWTLVLVSILCGERLLYVTIGSLKYGINEESLFFIFSILTYLLFIVLVIPKDRTSRHEKGR